LNREKGIEQEGKAASLSLRKKKNSVNCLRRKLFGDPGKVGDSLDPGKNGKRGRMRKGIANLLQIGSPNREPALVAGRTLRSNRPNIRRRSGRGKL